MRGLILMSFLIILVLDSWSLLVSGQVENTQFDACNADLSTFLPFPFSNTSGLVCRPIWNTFMLRYSQTEDNVMTIILSAVYTSGWVGMGFSKDGMMIGSSCMVGWVNREGRVHIKQYYIRGFNISDIIPNKGELQLTNIPSAVVLHSATIYLAFQLKFQNRVNRQPIILAFSTKTPGHHHLTEHDDKTTLVVNFHGESNSKPVVTGGLGDAIEAMKRNHGVLAIVGWGVFLPAGVIVARYFRHRDPLWYYLHISIQFVGFILGIAAVVAGKVLHHKMPVHIPWHSGIGTTVLVLSILQVMAFFARPNKDAKIRRYWNWYHHWLGRLALFLACLNIFIGIQSAGSGPIWKAGYGFILAVSLITCVILEILSQMKGRDKSPAFGATSI